VQGPLSHHSPIPLSGQNEAELTPILQMRKLRLRDQSSPRSQGRKGTTPPLHPRLPAVWTGPHQLPHQFWSPPPRSFKCFHCWVNSAEAFRSQPIKLAPLCSQKKIIMFSLPWIMYCPLCGSHSSKVNQVPSLLAPRSKGLALLYSL
jgi:hypothetical protein